MLVALWLLGSSAMAQPAASPLPRLLVVPTETRGVDPIVGRFVDRQLGRTGESSGHRVIRPQQARDGLIRLAVGYPPSMEDLWNAMQRLPAERAVFAVVWAEGGTYRFQLRLASRDGRGPFYGDAHASAEELERRVDARLHQLLAELERTAVPAAEAGAESGAGAVTESGAKRWRFGDGADPFDAWRVGVRTDLAFGVGDHTFFNLLLGGRLLYRVDDATAVGAFLAYANVETRGGRGASVLPALALEHRIGVGEGALSVPLRFLLGGLLDNGGVLRLSSGVAWALDDRTALSFDLIAPTLWVTPDRILLSLDLGVELSTDF